VAAQVFTVTQAGCTYNISPDDDRDRRVRRVRKHHRVGRHRCAWTASRNDAWITVTSGAIGGSGSGSVPFTVAENTGSFRTGTITVAGQTSR
jgi:hypothetical protein